MGIVLDFFLNTNTIAISEEKHQDILEICSLLIALYNHENPTSQITILVSKNQMINQLTHFSGDIYYQNQGLWYLIFGNKEISNSELGFFFSERINTTKFKNVIYDLFFISKGTLNFLDSNFFSVFMGKEHRRFSVISLNTKFFALQIMAKITGGKYITLINTQKKLISHAFLKKFKNTFFKTAHFINLSFSNSRLVLGGSGSRIKKKPIWIKTIKYCPKCKNKIFLTKNHWCEKCGIFIITRQDLYNGKFFFYEKSLLEIAYNYVFNLFMPILNGRLKNFKSKRKKIFNFNDKKKEKKQMIHKSSNHSGMFYGHHEILTIKS